jgi:hypothetical protein
MRYNVNMAPKTPKILRVLLIPEGDFWVAQCIDHDIAAQGSDPDGARRAFLITLAQQIELDVAKNRVPLEAIKPAPEWYFTAYEHAQELPTWLQFPQSDPQPSLDNLYVAQAICQQQQLSI